MTDHEDLGLSPDHDADHDAVRRLLADARHTGPMPEDVVARMDSTLADLAGSSPAAAQPETAARPIDDRTPAEVVSLSAHRRRRAASLLVAAAAIVVGGVAVTQLHPGSSPTGGAAASAGRTASTAPSAVAGDHAKTAPSQPVPESELDAATPQLVRGRVVVRPQHFADDALGARRLLGRHKDAQRYGAELTAQCTDLTFARARTLPASYQRAPAFLVFHQAEGTTQVVDLYLCGQSTPIRSVTLPLG